MASRDELIGRTPTIHLAYYAWNDDWSAGVASDLGSGRISLINWEPHETSLKDIVSGRYDTMLMERAKQAKTLGKRFFLDWGAEMNGDWSPWGGAQNGKSSSGYVAAYRYIHDVFTAQGATNVVWAWCPNTTDNPPEAWNEAMGYYPGDGYVDWVCVDGYNWGNMDGEVWQTFKQVFAGIYPKLAATNKPILIGEMATAESGGNKAAWIDGIIPTLRTDYPMIKGLVWFDINKETDWRIDSSTESLAAFRRLAADAYMNP